MMSTEILKETWLLNSLKLKWSKMQASFSKLKCLANHKSSQHQEQICAHKVETPPAVYHGCPAGTAWGKGAFCHLLLLNLILLLITSQVKYVTKYSCSLSSAVICHQGCQWWCPRVSDWVSGRDLTVSRSQFWDRDVIFRSSRFLSTPILGTAIDPIESIQSHVEISRGTHPALYISKVLKIKVFNLYVPMNST